MFAVGDESYFDMFYITMFFFEEHARYVSVCQTSYNGKKAGRSIEKKKQIPKSGVFRDITLARTHRLVECYMNILLTYAVNNVIPDVPVLMPTPKFHCVHFTHTAIY